MTRQIYQQIGLVLSLIVASVSLPIGIIGFTREPQIINNYYNTYNNQTIIGINETDYSTPIESNNYYNLQHYEFILRRHNLSSNYAYWYYWNASVFVQLRLWGCQGIYYEEVIALNGSSGFVSYIDDVNVLEYSEGNDKRASYYIPPFEDEWLFIWVVEDSITLNITLQDAIYPI